jgi:colanic acid biosynthesis glycosyl transferase WcaI
MIVFHDYGGHAFTAQIARHLAGRGMNVTYLSFSGFGTPKGRVLQQDDDPATFCAEQISLGAPVNKDNLPKRLWQQHQYARKAAAWVLRERPSIVVSSNCPLEVQQAMRAACRRVGAKFVFWLQDIHSEAIGRLLSRKNKLLGRLAGAYYQQIEKRLLGGSDAVIAIASDFVDVVGSWGVRTKHFSVIENWAPLEDLRVFPRDNPVAERLYRPGRLRLVYSGTLARKHNPELLLQLAGALDADVHLFSEGSAADFVREHAARNGLENVFVHPWVAFDELPQVFGGSGCSVRLHRARRRPVFGAIQGLVLSCGRAAHRGLHPAGQPCRADDRQG